MRRRRRAGRVLTLLRKPLSTLAALTDRDLGMRMGFSRITVGWDQKEASEPWKVLTFNPSKQD